MDRNVAAFLAVAETGNLTLAADKVALAQPSLSKRLAKLEESLGVQLFERHRRGMELTGAGKLFAKRAIRIRHEFDQAKEELRSLSDAGMSSLRVGAGPLFSLNFIAPAFAAMHREMPMLRLDLIADTNNHTLPKLHDGELDLVFGVLEPARVDDSIIMREFTTVEHGVVLSADDPLACNTKVDAEQLLDRQWVIYSDDPETERWLTGYFVRHGLAEPVICVRTSSFANGMDLVRQRGFAMIAPIQLSAKITDFGLVALPTDPLITQLPAGAYMRSSSVSYGAITRFVDLVEEQVIARLSD